MYVNLYLPTNFENGGQRRIWKSVASFICTSIFMTYIVSKRNLQASANPRWQVWNSEPAAWSLFKSFIVWPVF